MGLFSFVKEAGSKLFGKKKTAASAPASAPEAPVLSQEELDSMKADELLSLVNGLNLPIDSLYVAVEDDVATIAGTAESQATKEKAILAIGNVEGIAAVDDKLAVATAAAGPGAAPTSAPESQANFYTVQSGDSLSKIAKAHYGDPLLYTKIFEANQPMLKDPNMIYPGQVLRIP